jgi:uncharacterized protein (TIGR03000 family)
MYSMVLMMALTTSDATPMLGFQDDGVITQSVRVGNTSPTHELYRRGRRGGCCGGCYGCCGGCCGGCWGCCGGCCGGCWGGGGYHGHHGGGGYAMAGYGGAPYYAMTPGTYDYQSAYAMPAGNTSEARIVVNLPAEARLTIDGNPTTSTSTVRTFVTPPLTPGQVYHYTLAAQLERDGKPMTATKEVAVRPGQETRVSLDFNNGDVSLNK